MNILFLTLIDVSSIEERTIYTDLLREFRKNGHDVFVISPTERRNGVKTHFVQEENCRILKLRIGNIQKTNLFEKGINTIVIEPQFIWAIKKFFNNVTFDLVLYSTPPITLCKAVRFVKERDKAKTYLLLKDIFPQNAVDIGMMSKNGVKGLLYRYFRKKEKNLYEISDRIGCMSEANVAYILEHNPELNKRDSIMRKNGGKGIVEVCPNSIEPVDLSITPDEKMRLRKKYNIPQDKTVFVYGGNLGKPQGIDFMLKCLHSQRKNDKVFFLIVGNGTEYRRIQHYMEKYQPPNIALHQWIPKEEYDKVIAACDVGMIFLDHRFTIPNFPSRLLGYMSAKLPVLAVTDTVTDVGKVIVEGGFGWWCSSDDIKSFSTLVPDILNDHTCGDNGFAYLYQKYTAAGVYSIIDAQSYIDRDVEAKTVVHQ